MEKALSTKAPRKKVGERQAIKGTIHLSEREIAVLATIDQKAAGGPITTSQLSLLHWPPDLAKMLGWWGLDNKTVASLMNDYSPAHLAERVALGKFLQQQAKTAPEQLGALHPLWQQAITQLPAVWIRQAIDSNVALPEVFITRPRHPSDVVSSKAKRGIRYLFDAGLIIPDEMPVRRGAGSGQLLWYLTPTGRRRLAAELGVEVNQIAYRRPGELSDFTLSHRLKTLDLSVAVHLSAARLGYTVVKDICDEHLKQMLAGHQVTYEQRRDPQDPRSSEQVKGMTVPDYFFLLLANGKYFAHLVEVDRATITVRSPKPGLRDFKRRILILSEMYRSGLYNQLFATQKSFRYLTITTGGVDATGRYDRLQSLRSAAEEAVTEVSENQEKKLTGLQRYWFTHWDAVKPSVTDYFSYETILSAAVFQRAGDDQLRALIW